jgi:hypothetical protein
MRKKWKARFSHKTFNDHLTPLGKLLVKNAGRPWNQVWSEVCEHADERSTSGYHLREHVWSYVEHHAWEEGGRVFGRRRCLCFSAPSELRPGDFYVCSETRLLKMYKPNVPQPLMPWEKKASKAPKRVQAGPLRQYQLVNNCWFELFLAEVPKDSYGLRDAFLKRDVFPMASTYNFDRGELIDTYGCVDNGNELVYCVKKRQLSKSEIRKAGLKR